MSLPYCDPIWRNLNRSDIGWRGSGSLFYEGSDTRLITQYNGNFLSDARNFRFLYSMDNGLLYPKGIKRTTIFRPPGSYRSDHKAGSFLNKNRICARLEEVENNIKVWMVREHGFNSEIEEYSGQLVLPDDLFNWKLELDVSSKRSLVTNAPIFELRCAGYSKNNIFARCGNSLVIVEDGSEAFSVFKGSVRSFEENPYLPADIALVDKHGFLWTGTVGLSLARTKTDINDAIKIVTHSEHPRVVFTASHFFVRSYDLRCDNRLFSNTIFEIEKLSGYMDGLDVRHIRDIKKERSPFTHLRSLPSHEHYILGFTGRNWFLLDDRFPGTAILKESHSISEGGCSFLTSRPTPISQGILHTTYILDQFHNELWMLDLFEHASGQMCSCQPLLTVGNSLDFNSSLVAPTTRPICAEGPIRGAALLQGFRVHHKKTDILLKLLDDATLSYRPLFYGNIGGSYEKDITLTTNERVQAFSIKRERCSDLISRQSPEAYLRPLNCACLTDVESPIPDIEQPQSLNPLSRMRSQSRLLFDPLSSVKPKAELSDIVRKCYQLFKNV